MAQVLDEKFRRFARLLNCILYISQFFCAAPIVRIVKPSSGHQTQTGAFIRILARCAHLLWSASYAAVFAYIILSMPLSEMSHLSVVEQTMFYGRFFCSYATTLLILVGSQLCVNRYQTFVDDWLAVDRRLTRFEGTAVSGGNTGISCAHARDLSCFVQQVLAVFLAFVLSIMLIDFASADWNIVEAFWSMFAYVAPNITASCVMLQFVVALRMVEQQFVRITLVAERVIGQHHGTDAFAMHVPVVGRRSLTPMLGEMGRRSTPSKPKESRSTEVLDALRLEHIELSRIWHWVTGCYGLVTIGLVMTGILDMTVQLYLYYKFAVHLAQVKVVLVLESAVWMVLVASRLLLVMWQCDRVNEVRRQIASAMFRVELNGTLINEAMAQRIDQFAMQLLHIENDQPNAGGVMELNLSLISTLITAMTMYLVILIQFNAGERNV